MKKKVYETKGQVAIHSLIFSAKVTQVLQGPVISSVVERLNHYYQLVLRKRELLMIIVEEGKC